MIAFIEGHRDAIRVEPIRRHLSIAPSTSYDHMAKPANPDLLSDRAKWAAAVSLNRSLTAFRLAAALSEKSQQ